MPIVKWTLWQRRWSIFWWALGIALMVVFVLAFYPPIRDQAAELDKSFGGLSAGTLALFGGTDFFSPLGYLNSQVIYLVLPLLLAILGIGLGGSLIGREESEGTIELLLARPVSRARLLLAKAMAGGLIILIVTFISSVATIVTAKAVNLGIPLGNIAAACFACFMLVLTFYSLSFLLAVTGRARPAALGITVAYALGGYIIGSLAPVVHWLKNPSLIFPYHYYHSADILQGTFSWSSILFFAAFIAGCIVVSWSIFRRSDIR